MYVNMGDCLFGERIPCREDGNDKAVNFILQGMVEKWLIQVEEIMIQSLMKVTEDAVAAYSSTPRERWVKEWPGQIILAVSGIYWTMDVSKVITEKDGLKVEFTFWARYNHTPSDTWRL